MLRSAACAASSPKTLLITVRLPSTALDTPAVLYKLPLCVTLILFTHKGFGNCFCNFLKSDAWVVNGFPSYRPVAAAVAEPSQIERTMVPSFTWLFTHFTIVSLGGPLRRTVTLGSTKTSGIICSE